MEEARESSPSRSGPELAWHGKNEAGSLEGGELMPCSEQQPMQTAHASNEDNSLDVTSLCDEASKPEHEEMANQQHPDEETREPQMESMTLLMKIEKLMTQIEAEKGIIEETHFKDYDRLDHLRAVSDETQVVCRECEAEMGVLGRGLQGLKKSLEQIKEQIDRRLTNAGLVSWLENPKPLSSGARICIVTSYM
jgi:hypothetical protein